MVMVDSVVMKLMRMIRMKSALEMPSASALSLSVFAWSVGILTHSNLLVCSWLVIWFG